MLNVAVCDDSSYMREITKKYLMQYSFQKKCWYTYFWIWKTYYYYEDDILYVEGYGKNCILHFSDSKKDVICSKKLSDIEEKLSKDTFFRCHKSYIVNLKHVDAYSHSDITLDSGETVDISRNKYRDFGEALMEFVTKKRGM